MKKYIFALLLVFSFNFSISTSHAQNLDTLGITERVPNYYYWDTNWWDHYFYHPSIMDHFVDIPAPPHIGFMMGSTPAFSKAERARYIYIDTFLTVIGVAGVQWFPREDLTPEPEYYRIYEIQKDTEMVLLAEARWDTTTPKFYMPVEYKWEDSSWRDENDNWIQYYVGRTFYRKVYEAYFEEPVVVHDSFYVSQTSNNCYNVGFTGSHYIQHEPYMYNMSVHAIDYFIPTLGWDSIHPIPPHFKIKKHFYDEYNCDGSDGLPMDTNWHIASQRYSPNCFLCVFPIFDTNIHHVEIVTPADTCLPPTGLRIMEQENTTVTLAWNGGEDSQWELSLTACGMPIDSGTTQICHTPFVTLDNLNHNTCYLARVRTLCDNDKVSEWCDSVMFRIGTPPASITNIDDLTTYLMPNPATDRATVSSSFKIRNIDVFSLEGKLMLSHEVNAITTTLNTGTLPKGAYILRINTHHSTSYKKLIIER